MIYALLEPTNCASGTWLRPSILESATSHQLRQLRLAGLVPNPARWPDGHYRIADDHVRILLDGPSRTSWEDRA